MPTASPDTCEALRAEADEVICTMTPEPFFAVGHWYDDFTQTTDEEVHDLLARGANLSTVKRTLPRIDRASVTSLSTNSPAGNSLIKGAA